MKVYRNMPRNYFSDHEYMLYLQFPNFLDIFCTESELIFNIYKNNYNFYKSFIDENSVNFVK